MYTIEKNVPLEKKNGAVSSRKFLDTLEVGDSFVCPSGEAQLIQTYAGQRGQKLARRKIDTNSSRVWRIE